jgi:hypothetical protein
MSRRKECCEVAQEEIKKALAAAEIDPSVLAPVAPKKAATAVTESKADAPTEPSGPRVCLPSLFLPSTLLMPPLLIDSSFLVFLVTLLFVCK